VSGSFVVVRRSGSLWGLPAEAVAAIESGEGHLRIRFAAGGALEVDTLVGLARHLDVRRAPRAISRWLPEHTVGLAIHQGEPVLVADGAPSQRTKERGV